MNFNKRQIISLENRLSEISKIKDFKIIVADFNEEIPDDNPTSVTLVIRVKKK